MRDIGPLSVIPYPIRILVGYLAYSKVTKTLHGQGIGRYNDEEYSSLYRETWESLDALVAAKTQSPASRAKMKTKESTFSWILGGEKPTEADACLFGFLAGVMTAQSYATISDAWKLVQELTECAGIPRHRQ